MRTHSPRTSHVLPATSSSVNLAARPFAVQAMKKQGHFHQADESSQESQSPKNSPRPGRDLSNMDVFPRQNPSAEAATALPGPLRAKLESAFQSDFSQVRIHANDPGADSINAVAATRGKDVHFAPGQYDPSSQEGQRIIGHEMAHVVQQMQGRVASPMGRNTPINTDQRLEAEADEWGAKAIRGEPAGLPNAGVIPSGGAIPTANPPIQGMFTVRQIAKKAGPRVAQSMFGRGGRQFVSRSYSSANTPDSEDDDVKSPAPKPVASGTQSRGHRLKMAGLDVLTSALGFGDSDPAQDAVEHYTRLSQMVADGHITEEEMHKIFTNQK